MAFKTKRQPVTSKYIERGFLIGKTCILCKWKIINSNILHIEYHLGYPAFKKLQYITERCESTQKQWILQGERCIDGFT